MVAAWLRPRPRAAQVPVDAERIERAGVADAPILWCVFLAVVVAAMVTYARLPARELYHVLRRELVAQRA